MPSSAGYKRGIPTEPFTKWETDTDQVQVDYKNLNEKPGSSAWLSGKKGVVLKVLLLGVIFSLGMIIGYVIRRNVHEVYIKPLKLCNIPTENQKQVTSWLREAHDLIDVDHMRWVLKNVSYDIHISGTGCNNMVGRYIASALESFSLDNVNTRQYKVLLSYKNWVNRNHITLLGDNESIVFVHDWYQKAAFQHPQLLPYSAYSPNATVKGPPVFANYGRLEDFAELEKQSVNLTGAIVFMKNAISPIGDKVKLAEERGAAGVVLFSDPADFTQIPKQPWPRSPQMPDWVVQRETVRYGTTGDPLTPGLPSKPGVYRIPEKDASLPHIPVQPMAFNDTDFFLRSMAGPEFPKKWSRKERGYKMGPGYTGDRTGNTVRMVVRNERIQNTVTNVVGHIRGAVEPDRYVIVGCHYDAWTHGASEPSTGIAVLIEVAKVLGILKEKGWKPRRTILLAAWDAGEFGQIGATEWVEENSLELKERTVAYVNLDGAVRGNYTLSAKASPLMKDVIIEASKMVDAVDFDTHDKTVYDMWLKKNKDERTQKPRVDNIDASSDHTPFVQLGIPVLWPVYRDNFRAPTRNLAEFPAYHTSLDDYRYMERFVDGHFRAHKAMTSVVVETILKLSDTAKLPFNIRTLNEELKLAYDRNIQKFKANMTSHAESIDIVKDAIKDFEIAATTFQSNYEDADPTDALTMRRMNDVLMLVSRAFIHAPGLPGRPMDRNILLSRSLHSSHANSYTPGIVDAMLEALTNGRWDRVAEQLSILAVSIEATTNILKEENIRLSSPSHIKYDNIYQVGKSACQPYDPLTTGKGSR